MEFIRLLKFYLNAVVFSIFMKVCVNNHHLILKHFFIPKKKSHNH